MGNKIKEQNLKTKIMEDSNRELQERNKKLRSNNANLKLSVLKKNVELERIQRLAKQFGIDLTEEPKTRKKELGLKI